MVSDSYLNSKGFPSIVREFLLDKGASFLVKDSFYSNGFPSIVMDSLIY